MALQIEAVPSAKPLRHALSETWAVRPEWTDDGAGWKRRRADIVASLPEFFDGLTRARFRDLGYEVV
jgi:hypothetical protein